MQISCTHLVAHLYVSVVISHLQVLMTPVVATAHPIHRRNENKSHPFLNA